MNKKFKINISKKKFTWKLGNKMMIFTLMKENNSTKVKLKIINTITNNMSTNKADKLIPYFQIKKKRI